MRLFLCAARHLAGVLVLWDEPERKMLLGKRKKLLLPHCWRTGKGNAGGALKAVISVVLPQVQQRGINLDDIALKKENGGITCGEKNRKIPYLTEMYFGHFDRFA